MNEYEASHSDFRVKYSMNDKKFLCVGTTQVPILCRSIRYFDNHGDCYYGFELFQEIDSNLWKLATVKSKTNHKILVKLSEKQPNDFCVRYTLLCCFSHELINVIDKKLHQFKHIDYNINDIDIYSFDLLCLFKEPEPEPEPLCLPMVII